MLILIFTCLVSGVAAESLLPSSAQLAWLDLEVGGLFQYVTQEATVQQTPHT